VLSYHPVMTLSVEKREVALRLRKQGMSNAKVAAALGVDRSTIIRLLERVRDTGDITPKSSSGRPRMFAPRDERELVRIVRRDPTARPSNLRTALLNSSSRVPTTRTIQNILHRGGLNACRMRRKPRLTKAQREARLEWAQEYAKKPAEFWDTVIFSDETSIHVHEAMRGSYVWRFKGEDLEPGMVQETTKFGGSKLQVWGCLTSQGVGYACSLPDGLDAETYLGILKEELADTINLYFEGFKGVVFQQDGASTHTAKVVKAFFRKQKYTVIPWPAHSPDLSPIENLWGDLKKRLLEKHPEMNKHHLWEVVDAEWEATPTALCATLLHSMPDRLQDVIKAQGGYTKY